jgi:hypothetical protein
MSNVAATRVIWSERSSVSSSSESTPARASREGETFGSVGKKHELARDGDFGARRREKGA